MRSRLPVSPVAVIAAVAGFALLGPACSDSDDVQAPTITPDGGAGDDAIDPDGSAPDADNVEPDADPGPITVTGSVVSAGGQPLVGLGVSVAGMPLVYTGLDGTFTFTGVTTPYDLTVTSAADEDKIAHTFVGLTTTSPRVTPQHALGSPLLAATVSGSIGGAVPTGQRARVCVEGLSQRVTGCQILEEGETTYSFEARWDSGSNVQVRVRALRMAVNAQGAVTEYTAAGVTTATLTAGDSSTVDLSMGPGPGKATVTATLTAPPGSAPEIAVVAAKLGEWDVFPLESRVAPAEPRASSCPLSPEPPTRWSPAPASAAVVNPTAGRSGWPPGGTPPRSSFFRRASHLLRTERRT